MRELYLRQKIEQGDRLISFNHRVYKVRDPRTDVLASTTKRLYTSRGDEALYELALDECCEVFRPIDLLSSLAASPTDD